MVLTGKQALDYSGGVSAEDNFGIGGYERIMGPNGQAQYWAPDLAGACAIAARATTSTPTSRPASASRAARETADPLDRDVRAAPHQRARLRRSRRVGDDLLRRDQPGPQEAVRHPLGDARRRSTPTTRRSSAGPGMRERRGRGRLGRAPRRLAGRACSASSRARCRATARCPPTAPSSGRRARCSRTSSQEDRARDQRRQRPPAAGRAGQPGRLRRLAGVDARAGSSSTAPRSAARSSTSTARSSSASISRYHGGAFVVFSQRLNDEPRDDRARGRARVGDRRRARRRGRVRPRRRRRRPARDAAHRRRSTSASRPPRAPSASACAPSATTLLGRRCCAEKLRRARGRVRRDPQRRARGRRSARSSRIVAAARRCART